MQRTILIWTVAACALAGILFLPVGQSQSTPGNSPLFAQSLQSSKDQLTQEVIPKPPDNTDVADPGMGKPRYEKDGLNKFSYTTLCGAPGCPPITFAGPTCGYTCGNTCSGIFCNVKALVQ